MLPQRDPKNVVRFRNVDTYEFYTNYYDVIIDKQIMHVYQYALESDISADSSQMIYQSIKAVSHEL